MRENVFLKRVSIYLSSKLSLTYRVNVNHYKKVHHPMLLLLYLWEQGTPCQFSKQISKISFQLTVQIYTLLGQTEGEKKVYFGGCKKRDHIVGLSPRALGCHKRLKIFSFCIWNPTVSKTKI